MKNLFEKKQENLIKFDLKHMFEENSWYMFKYVFVKFSKSKPPNLAQFKGEKKRLVVLK